MGKRILAFAGAIVLVALMGKFLALPVIAQQVRAVLIQDRDSKARNFYQDYSSCGTTIRAEGFCEIRFPAVPAGKRLIVEHVSVPVNFFSTGNTAPAFGELSGHGAGSVSIQLIPFPFRTNSGLPDGSTGPVYQANETVLAAVDPATSGPLLDLYMTGTDSFTAAATISGYMIDIP